MVLTPQQQAVKIRTDTLALLERHRRSHRRAHARRRAPRILESGLAKIRQLVQEDEQARPQYLGLAAEGRRILALLEETHADPPP